MERRAPRRIAVALDASAHGLRVMDLAAGVAALLEAELEGIFVEDTELLRTAGLPFLRELRLGTLEEAELTAERLQRELRVAARRVRETLEQSARSLGVACSFRIWRGDLGAEILAAAVDAELFALGRIGRFAPLRTRPKGRNAPGRAPDLTVGVIFDGGDASERALATAVELARDRRAQIAVVLEPSKGVDAEDLRAQATRLLEAAPAPPHGAGRDSPSVPRRGRLPAGLAASAPRRPLQGAASPSGASADGRDRWVFRAGTGDTAALAQTILDADIDLLVVDSESPMLAAPTLWERLQAIDCPVLIHRTSP